MYIMFLDFMTEKHSFINSFKSFLSVILKYSHFLNFNIHWRHFPKWNNVNN